MAELIRNAWLLGWSDYTRNGKFAALLLIALVIYWLVRRDWKEKYRTLAIYTTIMTICCIFPLTAAFLMLYQTRFYDYQWIWNLVPVTIVIALAGTLLWTEFQQKFSGRKDSRWKIAGGALLMLAVVYLCGRMGNTVWQTEEEAAKRQETANVLEVLAGEGQTAEMVLWAPQGIMEYIRTLDGNIRLPYGRNMWDISLNAYTYDGYEESENTLYTWMSNVEETGEDETIAGSDCMDIAQALGVTHILLPGNILPETLAELQTYLDVHAEPLEGYYMLRIQ